MSFCGKHEKGYRYGQPCQTCEIERLTALVTMLDVTNSKQYKRIAKLEAALGKIVKYQPGSSDALNIATRALKNTEVTDE